MTPFQVAILSQIYYYKSEYAVQLLTATYPIPVYTDRCRTIDIVLLRPLTTQLSFQKVRLAETATTGSHRAFHK